MSQKASDNFIFFHSVVNTRHLDAIKFNLNISNYMLERPLFSFLVSFICNCKCKCEKIHILFREDSTKINHKHLKDKYINI